MAQLKKEHKDFADMKSRWEMCQHAAEGEYRIHAEREKYLPRLQEEDDDAYALRLRMTPFLNATWRTIVGMRGMVFRKPPKVEFPAPLAEILDNIDLAGTTMLGLAQRVTQEALTVGRVGLLVDFPAAPLGSTLADAKKLNLRPLIALYTAGSVYNWETSAINSQKVLTQVRLSEKTRVATDNEFESKEEDRYRVLDLIDGKYRQRMFKIDEDGAEVQIGEDLFATMNGQPMDFIPFVVIGVDSVGPDVVTPPLIDLVTTNLHHYMQATSYERGCFFSGLPTMFISGMEDSDSEIAIGGPVANALGSPAAKAYYVEVTSKFEALRTNLEDKKREMAILGARMLESQGKQVEAAETVARRLTGEESVLSSMAQTISQGLTRALTWVALWAGSSEHVEYELNEDFMPQGMTPTELTALIAAWQSGAISQQTLFDNLKKGEVVDDALEFEEEQERIQSQFPAAEPLP